MKEPRAYFWMQVRKQYSYLSAALAVLLLLAFTAGCGAKEAYYETHDITQYGIYPGRAQAFMTEYIGRFFPDELSDDFRDIQYTFYSSEIDEYAFEAYLEFTLEDEARFLEHVQDATEGLRSRPFYFEDSFQEYVLYNEDLEFFYDYITLGNERIYGNPPETHYQIQYADIAKILVNESEHRIIYVALALHDGGGDDTGSLNAFFSRFDIDPREYERFTEQQEW